MDFEKILPLLEQAQGDPQALALVTHDILLSSRPEALRRAVEAAAVPHWFDADILRQLLDPDLQGAAEEWYRQIAKLPFCERFAQRGGHNLHESTRLAIRKRLSDQSPERLQTLSRRAAEVFSGESAHARIENAYHQLWADPEKAGPLVRQLEYDLRHRVEDSLALAVALQECTTDDAATPPLVAAWAIWATATVRAPYLTIQERLQLALRMVALTERANLPYAQAAASALAGDALVEHGHRGDAEQALGHYQRSLEVRERLLAANPESAQAARDVSVSLNKLADFLASRGLAGDAEQALGHYQRSLEVQRTSAGGQPGVAQAARDVSVSLSLLADFLASRGLAGDAEQALGHYQRSLEVSERLLAANPESAQAARDVSVSLDRLGDFLASRGLAGDAEQALGHYQRSLEVSERLLAANPESCAGHAARRVGELGTSLGRLSGATCAVWPATRSRPWAITSAASRSANVCWRPTRSCAGRARRVGELGASRRLSGESRFGRRRGAGPGPLPAQPRGQRTSAGGQPGVGEATHDVSVSLNKLADFLARRGLAGDAEQALGHYQRSLEVRERLLAANPESAQAAQTCR